MPVVADLKEALRHGPKVAVVGLAPSGGRLPEPLRQDALAALNSGLSLASGLHPIGRGSSVCRGLPARALDLGSAPRTVRPSGGPGEGDDAALPTALAVGTDMAVGKMSACLALRDAAMEQGMPCRFVGTGQAGILISGTGVPLDAVRVDYAAGAVEAAVLQAAEVLSPEGLVVVEGQGSLCHPGSTATLPLMRGSQPTDLLLVHRAGQTTIDRLPNVPLPPLAELIQLCEGLATIGRPASAGPAPRVRAIALNTARLDADGAQRALSTTEDELQMLCVDPIRQGTDRILKM